MALAEAFGHHFEDMADDALAGVEAAWLDDTGKATLRARIDAAARELGPAIAGESGEGCGGQPCAALPPLCRLGLRHTRRVPAMLQTLTIRTAASSAIVRSMAMLLALALALSQASAAMAQDAAPEPGPDGAGRISDAQAEVMIADIEALAVDARAALAEFESDRLHLDAVLGDVGTDASDIAAWVAMNTRWVPYGGSLRGWRGVLMDRSGNSLDRALLLAELLGSAGHDIRLARARLPLDVAADVVARELARAPSIAEAPALGGAETTEEQRTRAGTAAAELAAMIDIHPEAGADGLHESAVEWMADHWWVQADAGTGWQDLDPIFGPDSDVRPLPETVIDPADVPADLRHAVTVRVVLERTDREGRTELVPMEHTITLGEEEPPETLDLSFEIWLAPEAGPEEVEGSAEMVRLVGFWRPVLDVGSDAVRGEWFNRAGDLQDPADVIGQKLSEGTSALGALGEPSEADGPADSHLTAVWIEYEARSPRREPRVERRELFHLRPQDGGAMTPAEEEIRGTALLGETAILVQGAATHPDAVAQAYLQNLVDARSALIALVYLAAGWEDDRIGPSLDLLRQRPLDLLLMTAGRASWSPVATSIYLGRPNIWTRHMLVEPAGADVAVGTATDIALNDVDVLPGGEVAPVEARLQQGVVDTLVEYVLPADDGGLNTWERFSRRAQEGVPWSVIRQADELSDADGPALAEAELARLRRDLETGHVVVAAATSRDRAGERFADWWRIAEDGTTLGMGYRGWGSEATERGAIDPRVRRVDPRVQARFDGVKQHGACKNFETAVTVVDWLVVDDTLEFRRPGSGPSAFPDVCK